jgi:hypothetical protein
VVGVYETYDGMVIGIVDARAADCAIPTHQNGKQIPITSYEPSTESHRSDHRSRLAED